MPNPAPKLLTSLLLFVALLLAFTAKGQISKPAWVDDIGGPAITGSSSVPSAVKVDNQNNVYVTGLYQGTVDFDPGPGVYNINSSSGYDIYIAKYTTAGKFIWAKSIGGSGTDQVNSMTIDDAGNITISGQYDSSSMDADPGSGVSTINNTGGKDEFIIKLTTNGNFVWAKSIGGGGDDYGGKVVADSKGNILQVSQFQGSVNVEGKQVGGNGTFTGMVVKFNSNGSLAWAIDLKDNSNSEAHSCGVDADDNVIISGAFSSTVNFNPLGTPYNVNANGGSTFIAKYDKNGKLIWVKTIAGPVVNNNTNICVNSKGDIYIDGPFESTLTFAPGKTLSRQGPRDIFLAKYNSSGVFQVANDVGGSGSMYNYGIVASKDDDIYLSGYFNGTIDFDPSATSSAPITFHGQQDVFLAKYSEDLDYKWAFSAGSQNCGNTLGRNVEIDNNNDVLLTGAFCSTVDFDATTCSDLNLTAQSERDSFVGKYVQSTANANLKITAFSVPGQSKAAVIDQSKLLITLTVPTGTNVTSLVPTITVPAGVTLNPASGVAQNFTSPVTYKLTDNNCNTLNYTVKVVFVTSAVKTKTVCAEAADVLTGDVKSPAPTSYLWQINKSNVWGNAPGTINLKDYTTSALVNNTNANIVYSLRRQITIGGSTTYDSYYDVTVVPVIAISNNAVTAPAVSTFCTTGNPTIITGSTPTGGPGTYTYQWQKSTNNTTFTDITGATAKDYDPAVANATTYYRRSVTSGTCNAPALSNVITIKVEPALAANTITAPAVSSFCVATDPAVITGSTPTGGNGTYVYQWQSSTDNITFANIPGAIAKDYDPALVSVTTYYRRHVSSDACTVPLVSNVVTIQIEGSVAISNNVITAPAVVTFCVSGNPAVITGNTPSGGTGVFTYQWQKSTDNITFADITGATGISYDPAAVTADTWYRRVATSGSCVAPSTSNTVAISILPMVSNNLVTAPVVTAFCATGNPDVITGNVPSGGNGVYNYQWQSSVDNVNFVNIAGATLKDYDPASLTATTYFRRMVTSGQCNTPLASNVVTITIYPALSNNKITAPAVSTFCVSGNPAAITGNTPTGGDGTYTYQWQSSTDNINFTDIVGATGKNYDPGIISVVTYFRRMAVSGICNTPLVSNVVKIDLQPALTNNQLTAPLKTNFCSPGDAAAIIGSVPTGGDGTYSYQWQSSTDNVTFTDIAGAVSKDYDPVAQTATMYYRRLVASGACTVPLVSASVTISVETKLDNNTLTPPAIIVFCSASDPGAITGSTPTGGNGMYSYQWQSSTDNVNYTDIATATSRNYDPPVVNVSTYFRRMVTSDVCTVPLVSNVILIQIQSSNPIGNNLITAPTATTFCVNGNPALITGSTPSGGTGAFTYQWQRSADNINFTDISGATGISYDPVAITADTWYRRVASSGSCVTGSVSNVIGMKIQQAIAGNIISGPAVSTFCTTGDPALITGSTPTSGDGTYAYQWQKSTDNINFTDIATATAKDYDPVAISVTTYYRRLVTSGACTVPLAGNVVTIAIQQAIANNNITAPSVTSFCTTGDPGEINGSTPTGGDGTFSYQWQSSVDNINFINIPGATGKNYDPTVISADTYYRRLVTSGTCIIPVLSNVVGIKILSTPAAPTFVNAAPAVCPGNSTTITISSSQSGLTYNWYSSAAKINLLFSGTAFPTGVLNTATTYYVEATNNTCNSSLATVQVSMAPTPNAPVLVNNPVAVCTGSTAVLAVQNPQNGFTYNWYAAATDVTPLHTGINFTTPTINAATKYYVEAINTGGCSSTTRTAVDVTPLALPTVTSVAKAICPGSSATLTATSNDANAVISWYASATASAALQTGNSFTTPNLSSTTAYYVQAVSTANCSIPTRVKVEVSMLKQLDAPIVSVDATTNTTITFKWDAITGAEGYQVSIDNGQTFTQPSSGADGLSHTISNLQLGDKVTILVQALGASDCQLSGSSTAVTGTARSPLGTQIYVANTFTPNGDGNNDIVYVHGEGIKSVAFYVYDQWGELIFVSTDINKGWDGYYKGTREPVGVYVYYVKAVVNDGTQLTKKGTITLLR